MANNLRANRARRDLVPAEFENVSLGYAQVFEHHPGGMGKSRRFLSTHFHRDSGNGFVKCGVGVSTFQQVNQVLAQRMVLISFHMSPGIMATAFRRLPARAPTLARTF